MSRVVVVHCLLAVVAWAAPVPSPEPKSPVAFDRYLLPDTNSLTVVNVKAIVKSPLFEKHLAKESKALLALPMVAPHVKTLGIDPLTEIERIVSVAGRRDGDEKNPSGGYVIVQGKFSEATLRGRFDKIAKDEPKVLKSHGTGATQHYEVVLEGVLPISVFLAVVDRGTVVFSPTKDVVLEVQKAVRDGKKPALKQKDMTAFLAKMKPEPAVQMIALADTVAGMVPDPATGKTKLMTMSDTGFTGARFEVAVKDDARFKVELSGKTDEEIKKQSDNYDQLLGFIKKSLAEEVKKDATKQPYVRLLDGLKSRLVAKVLTIEGVLDADIIKLAIKDMTGMGK